MSNNVINSIQNLEDYYLGWSLIKETYDGMVISKENIKIRIKSKSLNCEKWDMNFKREETEDMEEMERSLSGLTDEELLEKTKNLIKAANKEIYMSKQVDEDESMKEEDKVSDENMEK